MPLLDPDDETPGETIAGILHGALHAAAGLISPLPHGAQIAANLAHELLDEDAETPSPRF
jgi:hypothetical protein